MKQVLTGSIAGGVSLLHGRRGFFFEPDNGATLQGGASNQQQQNNPGNGQPNDQQQQQAVSPFAEIDKAMLDDRTRVQIEKAEAEFATNANQAKLATKFQSEHDKLKAEYDKLTQQVQTLRGGQNQQQQQQQGQPKSLRDEIYDEYIQAQIPPEQAAKLADMNANIHQKAAAHLTRGLGQAMSPIVEHVSSSAAVQAFNSVIESDRLGIRDLPEVQEKIWNQTQQLAANGQVVDPSVIRNLARIYWAEHTEQHGMPNTQTTPMYQQPSIQPVPNFQNQQQQTRHTYPGAGAVPRSTSVNRQSTPLDPETAAALAATMTSWPVKPRNGMV